MTSWAFDQHLPRFGIVLTVAAFVYLLGSSHRSVNITYRTLFLVVVLFGATLDMANVVEFADLAILAMAFPNIIGTVIFSGKVRRHLRAYQQRHSLQW